MSSNREFHSTPSVESLRRLLENQIQLQSSPRTSSRVSNFDFRSVSSDNPPPLPPRRNDFVKVPQSSSGAIKRSRSEQAESVGSEHHSEQRPCRTKRISFSKEVEVFDTSKVCEEQVELKHRDYKTDSSDEDLRRTNSKKKILKRQPTISSKSKLNRTSSLPDLIPPPLTPRSKVLSVNSYTSDSSCDDEQENGLRRRSFSKGSFEFVQLPSRHSSVEFKNKMSDNEVETDNDGIVTASPKRRRSFLRHLSMKMEKSRRKVQVTKKEEETETETVEEGDYMEKFLLIAEDLRKTEREYVSQLEQVFKLTAKLRALIVPHPTSQKFFGGLDKIHNIHSDGFLQELEEAKNSPKATIQCFMKFIHENTIDLYIRRHWWLPEEEDLDGFEMGLVEEWELEPLIKVTSTRIAKYVKYLEQFIGVCGERNTELKIIADVALKVIHKLRYQTEVVKHLKKCFNYSSHNFGKCGQALLEENFSVSINGTEREKIHVYLCKNMVIFTEIGQNGVKLIDHVFVSECYYSGLKPGKRFFEIGLIEGRKRFILRCQSNEIKDQWCNELRKIMKNDS